MTGWRQIKHRCKSAGRGEDGNQKCSLKASEREITSFVGHDEEVMRKHLMHFSYAAFPLHSSRVARLYLVWFQTRPFPITTPPACECCVKVRWKCTWRITLSILPSSVQERCIWVVFAPSGTRFHSLQNTGSCGWNIWIKKPPKNSFTWTDQWRGNSLSFYHWIDDESSSVEYEVMKYKVESDHAGV